MLPLLLRVRVPSEGGKISTASVVVEACATIWSFGRRTRALFEDVHFLDELRCRRLIFLLLESEGLLSSTTGE